MVERDVAATSKRPGTSKGYGFVEFSHHFHVRLVSFSCVLVYRDVVVHDCWLLAQALAALRELNNNPEYATMSIRGKSVRLSCAVLRCWFLPASRS